MPAHLRTPDPPPRYLTDETRLYRIIGALDMQKGQMVEDVLTGYEKWLDAADLKACRRVEPDAQAA